jgi:hypothetical protein
MIGDKSLILKDKKSLKEKNAFLRGDQGGVSKTPRGSLAGDHEPTTHQSLPPKDPPPGPATEKICMPGVGIASGGKGFERPIEFDRGSEAAAQAVSELTKVGVACNEHKRGIRKYRYRFEYEFTYRRRLKGAVVSDERRKVESGEGVVEVRATTFASACASAIGCASRRFGTLELLGVRLLSWTNLDKPGEV